MCGTVIVSRDGGRSENLGGQRGQALLKGHLTELVFVLFQNTGGPPLVRSLLV